MSNTSFDKIIDKVFDGFKKITPALVAIAIMSALILFLPCTILIKMGLNNLPKPAIIITGLLFLLSCSLIVTILGSIVFNFFLKKARGIFFLKSSIKKFEQLSKTQKAILAKLMKSSSKSIKLDSISGDTLYLVKYHFIYEPNQCIDILEVYDNMRTYVPQPWLIDFFEKEPEFFELSSKEKRK